ncbi:MAG: leucine-rich repeat protein, partial [Ruminococcus sp.]|nr:leucine-rich repeat protein [Ruminococcus sp.]
MKKRFLKVTALCTGILCISIAGFSLVKDISVTACAEEITASGTIENLEWCISNNVLTISGEGDMPNIRPWKKYYPHTIIIKEGVTSICEWAFANMSNVTNVQLPSTLKKIGDCAFNETRLLKSIQVPDNVEDIGKWVFANTDLEYATLGNNITSIKEYTFSGCRKLKEITIPDTITEIGKDAFYYCDKLSSINIPQNLKQIGENAFKMSGIESITISSETKYETGVFSDCRQLKTISTDSTLTEIPDNFLSNCVSLSDVSNILGENTLSIGQEAFSNCNITEVTIPNSVQTIGNGAFRVCKSLKKVTLPENCSVIPYEMFSDCKKLSDIILPDSIETIGNNAFKNCKSLQQITLPENILSIGDSAFQNCDLTSITLPENLKSIGSLAFAVNKTFKNIIIPDSVETIYSDSFTNTESLTIGASAKIQYNYSNDSVYTLNNKQIKINCFKDASTLKELIVNENNPYYCSEDSVLYNKDKSIIYDVAATHCFKNGTMIIPSSVLKIDNILNSKNIRKFEVEEENTTFSSIDSALTSKDKKTLIQYPNGRKERDYIIPEPIQTITENAFYMSNLSSVVFSDSVTSIQSWAFLKSNIASISFSETLNEIKDYAFYYSKTPILSIPKSVSKIGSNICSSDTKTIIFDYNEEDSPEISNTMTNISSISYYAYDNSCIATQFPKQFISRSVHEKGLCGKNLIWELNGGDLVISGTGKMDEYSGKSFPWLNKNILTITIKGENITVAPYAFQYNTTLSDVYLSGVTKIGDSAFYNCKSLLNVFIDDSSSYTYIANRAFYNCNNLQKLSFPRNNIYYCSTAFENNSSITHLHWSGSDTDISLEEFTEAGKNRIFQTIYNEKTGGTISDWCYSKNNTLVQLAENLYNTPYMDSLREKYFENILHENNCTVDSSDKDLIKAICNYLKNNSAP